MKQPTLPITMPESLLDQLRTAAQKTGLSIADVIRQSAKLGLPLLEEKLCPKPKLQLYAYWDGEPCLIAAENTDQAKSLLPNSPAADSNPPTKIAAAAIEGEPRLLWSIRTL